MKHIARYPEKYALDHAEHLSEEPTIHPTCLVVDSHLGVYTELMAHTTLVESTFGDYSYTAGDVSIIYTDVGKFSNIAAKVRINPGNHPRDRVTQHHFTYRRTKYGFGEDDESFFDWRRAARCSIGHDTWLGHGALIMPGVAVGHGAIVGAGAVVTKDVPPWTVAAGVPAKVIGRRFDEETAAAMERIAWWDWDRPTLEARFRDLFDVAGFVRKYG